MLFPLPSRPDGLPSGRRPPHDAPHLSSHVGASRLRHQSGATDRKTPHILVHLLPDLLHLLFLLSAFPQPHDSTQPLHLLPGDPVPLLAPDQLWLLPNRQRLRLQLPACAQVSGGFALAPRTDETLTLRLPCNRASRKHPTATLTFFCVSGLRPRARVWSQLSPRLHLWPTTSLATLHSTNNMRPTATTPPLALTHPSAPSPRWRPTARRADQRPLTARALIWSRASRGWVLRQRPRFWTQQRALCLWGLD